MTYDWFSLLLTFIVIEIPLWHVAARVGYNPLLSLLLWVPGINVVALWVFAYGEFPNRDVSDKDAFEAWAKSTQDWAVDWHGNDPFDHGHTHDAWTAWKAARQVN
jgi:hypothetical protein